MRFAWAVPRDHARPGTLRLRAVAQPVRARRRARQPARLFGQPVQVRFPGGCPIVVGVEVVAQGVAKRFGSTNADVLVGPAYCRIWLYGVKGAGSAGATTMPALRAAPPAPSSAGRRSTIP
jgi:hypothetical protein